MRLLALAALFCSAQAFAGKPLEPRLVAWGLSLPVLEGLEEEAREEVKSGGLVSEEVTAGLASGARRARIVVTRGDDPRALEKLLQARRASLVDHFQVRNIEAGRVKPRRCRLSSSKGPEGTVFSFLADSQLKHFTCGKEPAKFRVAALLAACPRMVVELYYYFPAAEDPRKTTKRLLGFTCPAEGGDSAP